MKNVLLTGAGGGLGLALIKALLTNDNLRIYAGARGASLEALKEKYRQHSRVFPVDLDLLRPSSFEDAIGAIPGGVDILINNAAVAYRAVMEHVEDREEKQQFQTNYFAPRELIQRVLPKMKKKRAGKIINISSVSGMMAMPTMSSYSASKFALEGLSEALYYELRPFNIEVCIIQIGFVNSNSFKKVKRPNFHTLENEEEYHLYYESMEDFVKRLMNWTPSTPDRIAKTIVKKAINQRAPLRIKATIDAVFFSILRRVLPEGLYHRFLYWSLPSNWRRIVRDIKKSLIKD